MRVARFGGTPARDPKGPIKIGGKLTRGLDVFFHSALGVAYLQNLTLGRSREVVSEGLVNVTSVVKSNNSGSADDAGGLLAPFESFVSLALQCGGQKVTRSASPEK